MNQIRSYDEAYAALNGELRFQLPGKQLYLVYINNPFTFNEGDEPAIAVSYRGTHIVTFLPSGDVILAHGGYQTLATMSKMNDYVPVWVEVSRDRNDQLTVQVGGRPASRFEGDAILVRNNDGAIEQLPYYAK